MAAPAAVADVAYRDTSEVAAECALVAEAPFSETFMTAASPGIVVSAMENQHYGSREEYLHAVTEAMRVEYEYIVSRGLLLQIDAPDLAMERHTLFADRPLSEFLDWVGLVIDSINRGAGRHRPDARAPPRLLGQLRRAAQPRRAARRDPRAAVSRRRRWARDLHGQRAPRARVPVLRASTASRRDGARRRRHRHDEQLRGAPRGRRGPHHPRRRSGRRSSAHHRGHRLRVRYVGRDR